jgi:Mrp family chromosome partitioning ATPase
MPGKREEGYWKAAAILANSVRGRQFDGILVSAPSRGEGTTTVSLKVAHALSTRCDVRPLLVELDFWKPVLVKKLDLDPEKTLDKVLAGKLCVPAAVQILENGIAVLAAAVKPNPPDRHLAPLVAEIMDYAVGRADIVLVDTPPLTEHGAVLSVGSVIPRVMLVVRAGRTSGKTIGRFQQDLRNAGIEVCGAILNREKRFVPGWIERLFVS